MRRQHGIDTVRLVLVVVALGMIGAGTVVLRSWINAWADGHYRRGRTDAKLEAAELERMKGAAVDRALLLEEKRWLSAHQRADEAFEAWKEAKRETIRTRKPLASCGPATTESTRPARDPDSGQAAAAADDDRAGGAPGGAGLRLHWRFVGLHDGVYTGLDGQPLFAASAQFSGDPGRADTASPYGLDELLEVHGDNAVKLSTCRRSLVAARTQLETARDAWDKENGR